MWRSVTCSCYFVASVIADPRKTAGRKSFLNEALNPSSHSFRGHASTHALGLKCRVHGFHLSMSEGSAVVRARTLSTTGLVAFLGCC